MDGESASLWSELMDLSEQARTEFSQLRDLPAWGRKHWERYFQNAFQTYARLWAFQQDHRAALQDEGLQRSDIGDVASRIGQLYYSYYQRTGGLNFLSEAYTFYEAIHKRQYFEAEAGAEELLVKQLRFYTRFAGVCLLLGRREEVWEHVERLQALVDAFSQEGQATDVLEWRAVVQEVEHFLAADAAGSDPRAAPPGVRCAADSPLSAVPFTAPFLRLHEAVLACYWARQPKLGDLPLDTFRMLQALEWEDPAASGSLTPDRHHSTEYWARGDASSQEQENPAKYLLFRPTASELLAVVATACEALPPVSALLVYLSAAEDHVRPQTHSTAGRPALGEGSAPSEASTRGEEQELSGVCLSPPSSSGLDESYVYPEDLLPHTRRPLFLVVDSDNARAFRAIAGRERSYPTCCLMSPPAQPPGVRPAGECGRLFTLFLASPVLAMCALTQLRDPDPLSLASWQRTAEAALFEVGECLAGQAGGEWADAWVGMFGDVLLRRLLLHFLLCRAALALHREHGRCAELQPACFPPLPEAASTTADVVVGALRSVAEAMGVLDQFELAGPLRQRSFSESEGWQASMRGGRQAL